MNQHDKFVFKTALDSKGIKIIWKEQMPPSKNNVNSLEEDDLDIIRKTIEVGVDIPEGRKNAIPKHILVEKIITSLTYSI